MVAATEDATARDDPRAACSEAPPPPEEVAGGGASSGSRRSRARRRKPRCNACSTDHAADVAAWLSSRTALGADPRLAVGQRQPRAICRSRIIADEVVAVTRGYGEADKPEDFLDSFSAFVRDNINTIAALKLVVQRPRDLTRADLKELRLALDQQGLFRGQSAPRLGGCEERGDRRLDHRLRPSGGPRRSADAL